MEVNILAIKSAIEKEIKETFQVTPFRPGLDVLCEYQMGFRDESGEPRESGDGKLVRPLLCLTICEALGGESRLMIPAAASIEIVHRTSLIFDDIQDNGKERNGKPTAWSIWGQKQAINAGLTLSSYARLALYRLGYPPEDIKLMQTVLEKAVLDLCWGQYRDVEAADEGLNISLDSYIEIIDGKTAALFRAACHVGAIGAMTGRPKQGIAAALGTSIGILFQMHDDYLGVWGNEAKVGKTANDLVENKLSLPVVLAMEKDPKVADLRGRPEELREWLDIHRIQDSVRAMEEKYRRKAEGWLAYLPQNNYTHRIGEMINYFIERDV